MNTKVEKINFIFRFQHFHDGYLFDTDLLFLFFLGRLIFKLLIGINKSIEISLKLMKINEILKNKHFHLASAMNQLILKVTTKMEQYYYANNTFTC